MNQDYPYSITILGSSGGVAKAILSILNQSVLDKNDPLHPILKKTNLYLIDINQKKIDYFLGLFPNFNGRLNLLQFDLKNTDLLSNHLQSTNTKIVIEVSWADTFEILECCNRLGVYYINTALENTMVDEDESLFGFPLTERYKKFEDNKGTINNTTAIIGSGMNPGVVQWMTIKLLQDYPNEQPQACYIIEHDNSFFKNKQLIERETIYTSWSGECFLDEAILSYPMFVKHHIPLYLYEDVYATEYKVTLGSKEFYGCLMPHEEVLTLGKQYDMEIGFLYRVSEYTTEIIRSNLPNVDVLWDWNKTIIDPSIGDVEGDDLVGVLLVYSD